MPVKIFYVRIGTKIEKDMLVLENEINQFEKELDGRGMQISNITMAGVSHYAQFLYSIVHYGSKASG